MEDHLDERAPLLGGGNFSDTEPSESGEALPADSCNFSLRRWRLYLIEPLILVLVFAYKLSSTILKHRVIYQTCSAILHFNQSDCLQLGTKNTSEHIQDIEHSVQPYASRIFMASSLAASIFPAFCGLFIGGVADRVGRKPLLIISFTGYASFYAFCSIISYLAVNRSISPWWYLVAGLPLHLMGGNVPYTVAALCFLSDVSSEAEKPYRMLFYEAAIYIGLMAGSFASGHLYEATSAHTVFAVASACICFALLIIVAIIPESLHLRVLPPEQGEGDATPSASVDGPWQLVRDMWRVCCKPRPFKDRAIVWLAIGALMITVFVVDGSSAVFYLQVRLKFGWVVKEFTTYETAAILMPVLGGLFGSWLLRKTLRCSIILMALMAFVSETLSSLMKAFAVIDFQLYLAILMGALKSIAAPMMHTVIMNFVPASELGKILAFNGVLIALAPMLASPVYTCIYNMSLGTFPGGFHVLSGGLFLVAIGLVLVIRRKAMVHPLHYESILS